MLKVSVKKFSHYYGLDLPSYATAAAAGMDLLAAVEEDTIIATGQRALIPTGIAIALPPGYEAQVRPRSGLAIKNGISLVNSPGTIDSDYRGEIKVILINHGGESFTVSRGMRIAQMVIAPVVQIAWQERSDLESTKRGEGGFGHTGLS